MGYISTLMGDRLSALLMSLMETMPKLSLLIPNIHDIYALLFFVLISLISLCILFLSVDCLRIMAYEVLDFRNCFSSLTTIVLEL